jgi:hypothetical protein
MPPLKKYGGSHLGMELQSIGIVTVTERLVWKKFSTGK